LLEDTIALLRNHPRLQEQKIDIATEIPKDPVTVLGDADRLKQVFWNLSENALRAMVDVGNLTISVRNEGDVVAIGFKDTGVGLAPNQVEKIFEPFQSGFGSGTGLGLAIVYQIAQAHNGSISVQSSPNRGAEFILRLKKAAQTSHGIELMPRAAGVGRG
jgi:two-component system sensor histidine kinase PilS (NtrC family)